MGRALTSRIRSKVVGLLSLTVAAFGCGSRTDIENFSVLGPACDVTSDCTLIPASCCGNCGAPSREDIRVASTKALREGTDQCSGATCPACYQAPDPTLVATCQRGHCAIVDLLKDSATACTDGSQCTFRSSHCCGCGSADTVIALNSDTGAARVDDLVCDSTIRNPGFDTNACALECQAVWPSSAFPRCEAGHCKLVLPTD